MMMMMMMLIPVMLLILIWWRGAGAPGSRSTQNSDEDGGCGWGRGWVWAAENNASWFSSMSLAAAFFLIHYQQDQEEANLSINNNNFGALNLTVLHASSAPSSSVSPPWSLTSHLELVIMGYSVLRQALRLEICKLLWGGAVGNQQTSGCKCRKIKQWYGKWDLNLRWIVGFLGGSWKLLLTIWKWSVSSEGGGYILSLWKKSLVVDWQLAGH